MGNGVSTTKRNTKKPSEARSSAATSAKKSQGRAKAKTASAEGSSRARTRTTAGRRSKTRPAAPAAAAETLSPEVVAPAPAPSPEPTVETVIVTAPPEPALVTRVPMPESPPPRPTIRRGIFFDVENTSRAADVERVLAHLEVDRAHQATDFFAVGNWRVIGHDTARLLARHGAALVHSAPSVGVRDWSDLRIAVTAGVWLAGARPGDLIEIVSDDQAFDAVGDVASSLGVVFRRTSYRALAGLAAAGPVEESSEPKRRSRRSGRGRYGERERGERRSSERGPGPQRGTRSVGSGPPPPAEAPGGMAAEPHTAPHDEIVHVVRDLLATSPGGVSLDVLANALRSRGFSRPPGSPRLITRLRRIRELEIARNGLIRLVEGAAGAQASTANEPGGKTAPVTERPRPSASDAEWEAWAREAEERDAARQASMDEPASVEAEVALAAAETLPSPSAGTDEGADETAGENGSRRRRGRRGGRRRRGRRGGAVAAPSVPAADGV